MYMYEQDDEVIRGKTQRSVTRVLSPDSGIDRVLINS